MSYSHPFIGHAEFIGGCARICSEKCEGTRHSLPLFPPFALLLLFSFYFHSQISLCLFHSIPIDSSPFFSVSSILSLTPSHYFAFLSILYPRGDMTLLSLPFNSLFLSPPPHPPFAPFRSFVSPSFLRLVLLLPPFALVVALVFSAVAFHVSSSS